MEKKKFKVSLTTQILIATVAGIIFGAWWDRGRQT